MNIFKLPLLAGTPQTFLIPLAGQTWRFDFQYRNFQDAGWVFDVLTENGTPIVCGIPLVVGVDLFTQYDYLGLPGPLVIVNDEDGDLSAPTFEGLGLTSNLYHVVLP